MAAPTITSGDCTTSGDASNVQAHDVTLPSYSAGDLVVVNVAWANYSINNPVDPTYDSAPNGETINELVLQGINPGDSTPDQQVNVLWWVATSSYAGGTWTITWSEDDVPHSASVLVVADGDFDSTTPISSQTALGGGSFGSSSSSDTGTMTLNSDDGDGRLVAFLAVDLEAVTTPSGWTDLTDVLYSNIRGVLSVRDSATSDSESVSSYSWALGGNGDTSANVVYVIRGATAAPVSVTANTGSATAAGLTPTIAVSDNKSVSANVGAVTATGFSPTVSVTDHQVVEANVGAGSFAGLTPTVTATANQVVEANLGTATASGLTPTIATTDHQVVNANLGTATASGLTPTVSATASKTVEANVGAATVTGFTPTVSVTENQVVVANTGTATASGLTPTVTATANQTVEANLGTATISGLTPTVTASAAVTVLANTGAASVAGFSPVVTTGGNVVITPNVGSALFLAPTPDAWASNNQTVVASAGAATWSGYVPVVSTYTPLGADSYRYMYARGRITMFANRPPPVMVAFGRRVL